MIPGAQIDAYQFEPCGYSANAIMTGDYYWNIHVTPEKDFSYASFETNYPKENYEELLKQVIEIFKPGHINVTVMANKVRLNSTPESGIQGPVGPSRSCSSLEHPGHGFPNQDNR